MKYISDNLIRYRLKSGFASQASAAKSIGMKREQLNRLESGNGGPPTLPTLNKIAAAYNCTIHDLVCTTPQNASKISDNDSAYVPKFLKDILNDGESLQFIKKCLTLSKNKREAFIKIIGDD